MKGSEEEEFQNNREIRLPDDNLCDQNELIEDIVPPQVLVCFDIHAEDRGPRVCDESTTLRQAVTSRRHVRTSRQDVTSGRRNSSYRLELHPRSTSNEFRVGYCKMVDYCGNTICYLSLVERRDWNRHEHYNMLYA